MISKELSITMKIARKVMKIIFSFVIFIVSIIIIAISLNFIPIKFAVNLDDAKKNLKDGTYICETNRVSLDTGWYADNELNKHLIGGLAIKVFGKNPEKFLSEKTFDFKWYELYNQYLLIGDIGNFKEDKDTKVVFADLNVKKWQIIYPIRRESFRQYFTPKGYLTVYDYDWIKVIKSLWQ